MGQWFSRINYLGREVVLGLQRGGWMNWAAISTVAVLLFLLGISLQASWQVESLLNQFGSQLEVTAYLEPGSSLQKLTPVVAKMPQVLSVKAVSKLEAWEGLVKELGLTDIAGATELLNGNPLVDELRIKARSPQDVPPLVQQLDKLPGIDEILYGNEVLKQLAQLNQGIHYASVIVLSGLSLSAIVAIATTIRLISLARRTEIEIMQLVGATKSWITLPFMLQGVFFGVTGGAIAWSLICGVGQVFSQLWANELDFVEFLARTPNPMTAFLPLILVGFGGLVGMLGSWLAIRQLGWK